MRRPQRLLLALAIFAALAVVAPAVAVTATATDVVHYSPVTATNALAPGLKVTQRLGSGMCEAGSDVLPGVYRCFAGNSVLDPCWPAQASRPVRAVYCPSAPWSDAVARVSLRQALTSSPGGPAAVWGLQLTTGQRCLAAQGAHSFFNHGRDTVNYFCPGSLVLVNQANEHGAVWTIREATSHGGGFKLGPQAHIATAWLGLPSHL